MPTYCYQDNEGNVIEREFPSGKVPDQIVIAYGPTRETTHSNRYRKVKLLSKHAFIKMM